MLYTRPTPSRDENRKDPGRNRRESRQREDRKGERNGRQGEGTRNVKRCIAWKQEMENKGRKCEGAEE